MSNRIEKGNSLLQKSLSEILLNELNDPRLNDEMVTISRVSLSSDLKYAKVYLSLYGNHNEKEILDTIRNASGYIRSLLAKKVKFRVIPTLDFVVDDSMEYSQKINDLLKNIQYSNEDEK